MNHVKQYVFSYYLLPPLELELLDLEEELLPEERLELPELPELLDTLPELPELLETLPELR